MLYYIKKERGSTMPEIKYSVPRGEAETKTKNKYRDKNYDRMELAVPKGMKEFIKQAAKEQGYSSQNSYVVEAIKEKYSRDTGNELIL